MEIKIKAYAYTIDIITEIRYFCKCNNAVFGKFRIIFTCTNPSKPATKQNRHRLHNACDACHIFTIISL